MSTGLLGVALGGGLAVAGGACVEFLRSRAASTQRSEDRKAVTRGIERETLEGLQETAEAYKALLVKFYEVLSGGAAVPPGLSADFMAARSRFRAHIYRVEGRVREAFTAWERAAVEWSQQEGSATIEDQRWDEAMRACGEARRKNF